jgi:hypothetical protein
MRGLNRRVSERSPPRMNTVSQATSRNLRPICGEPPPAGNVDATANADASEFPLLPAHPRIAALRAATAVAPLNLPDP